MADGQSTTFDSIPVPEGAKLIPLTRGQFAIVDECDYESLSQWKWCVKANKYAGRDVWKTRQCVYMHRSVVGAPAGMDVDHINGNTLDNRRCNLRVCAHHKNLQNQGKQRGLHTSKYKGVSWNARKSKWEARLTVDKKLTFLGNYADESEAARVWDEAAKKHHGEYARLNFPEVQP